LTEAPVPTVLAILICEKIITEANTQNKTLVNVFNNIDARDFPTAFGPLSLFIRLADAEGDYVLKLAITRLESEETISAPELPIVTIPSRLSIHELNIKIPGIGFKEPGTYEFQLYANNVWIARTTLTVARRDPSKNLEK